MTKLKREVDKVINNKTIHFEIPGDVHKKLRALLFLKEISMQKFFRLMSEKLVENDDYIVSLVEKRVDDIKNKRLNKLRDINEKDLYDVISQNSPFKK